jgi:hypothetical protein
MVNSIKIGVKKIPLYRIPGVIAEESEGTS